MFNIKIIENVRKNLFFLFLLDETIVPHSLSQYKVLIKLLPIGYTYESFMQASSEQGWLLAVACQQQMPLLS